MNKHFTIPFKSRITLFVGAYGSGKSEVSVNFALWLAQSVAAGGPAAKQVTLCDLDMINPFYRSADARTVVEKAGIRLVAPEYANSNVDVPAMPAAVFSVFTEHAGPAVLDIGGEDLGARAVSSLKPYLLRQPCDLFMVVNPYRPFTDTPEKIVKIAAELQQAAGLPLTALVHNANLLAAQDLTLLNESWPILAEAARLSGLPVAFATIMTEISAAARTSASPAELLPDRTAAGIPLLQMIRTIHYPTDRL